MADRAPNLQDTFLNHVRKNKTPLTHLQPAGRGPLIMLGVEVAMAAWAAWIHFA